MIEQLFQVIEQWIPVSSGEKELLQGWFRERAYQKGEFFLEEGAVCRQVGFIASGLMRYYINDEGEDKTYGFATENEFVCNYESFVPQTPSRQNIQALEPCRLYVISYNDLQQLYSRMQHGERLGRLVIEQVFIRTLQEFNSFYTDPPEKRYAKFLEYHPGLQQRLSQYHVASYVGVKPQSLSRIRRRIAGGN